MVLPKPFAYVLYRALLDFSRGIAAVGDWNVLG